MLVINSNNIVKQYPYYTSLEAQLRTGTGTSDIIGECDRPMFIKVEMRF